MSEASPGRLALHPQPIVLLFAWCGLSQQAETSHYLNIHSLTNLEINSIQGCNWSCQRENPIYVIYVVRVSSKHGGWVTDKLPRDGQTERQRKRGLEALLFFIRSLSIISATYYGSKKIQRLPRFKKIKQKPSFNGGM